MVCNKEEGFSEDDFVVEFLGEVLLILYLHLYYLNGCKIQLIYD